ncbi:hypothetical protein H4W81_001608 [Nonomuraea africana]|uniref:Transposase n=1 Tax=Nonomuraea africana TaxID=46171 RepID=A0ABR9K9Z4_9ACTN|nr:hypothetical protein [Nonomuraea africana]
MICRDRAGSYADGAPRWRPRGHASRRSLPFVAKPRYGTGEDDPRAPILPAGSPRSRRHDQGRHRQRDRTRPAAQDPGFLRQRTTDDGADARTLCPGPGAEGQGPVAERHQPRTRLGLSHRPQVHQPTSVDELLAPTLERSSKLDEFKPYLTRRWNEGCSNAVQLHAEIKAQGFTGSRRAVQGWLQPLRGHQEVRQEPCPPPKPPPRHRLAHDSSRPSGHRGGSWTGADPCPLPRARRRRRAGPQLRHDDDQPRRPSPRRLDRRR